MLDRPNHGLRLRSLQKSFGSNVALSRVTLDVDPGTIVSVTGPSGAGKTTIARLIAGLEHRDSGEIWLGNRMIADDPPQARDVALMFESYALYPHMTVCENLLFPLYGSKRQRQLSSADAKRAVHELLELVEMAHLSERYPAELSGGQKQRVALCRTLIREPNVFLLDEPISHLDAKLRHKLRGEIRRRLRGRAVPSVWFTPDAMEALAVGSQVVVLIGGTVQQIGTPLEVYESPANLAVAKLIGDPPMNLLRGQLRRRADDVLFEHPAFTTVLAGSLRGLIENAHDLSEIVIGFRPSSIILGGKPGGTAEVEAIEPFGKYHLITARLGDDFVKIKADHDAGYRRGDRIAVSVRSDSIVAFGQRTGAALRQTASRAAF